MTAPPVQVFIVDDEAEVLEGIVWLLASVKIDARTFLSPEEFLAAVRTHQGPRCAVLDIRMPEMSGLEVQKLMVDEGLDIPHFFLSAHGDIPAAVNAMRSGAVDFLEKPFDPHAFLNAINRVIKLARERYAKELEQHLCRKRIAKLSPREREVMEALCKGYTSKEIARMLGLSAKTIDVHRANLMRKMEVGNVGQLQRLLQSPEPAAVKPSTAR